MATGPLGLVVRAAAVIAGVVLPMLTIGVADADLPLPPPPGALSDGGPVTVVVTPPSLSTTTVPVPAMGCVVAMSYDNSLSAPPGSLYRGQTACGSSVYLHAMNGQAALADMFGNVVSYAQGEGGRGPITSQGWYPDSLSVGAPGVVGSGPVPGVQYTIQYTTTMVLAWPQYWGPASNGCAVHGAAMTCSGTTTYTFLPGTQGGFVPG